MKNLSLIGIILLALAFLLYYMMPEFSFIRLFEPLSLMGILAGIGIGLIIGGIVGYVSKGSAIKAEQKRRELKQLQLEKAELEKQAADLAKQQAEFNAAQATSTSTTSTTYTNENPQNY